MDVLLLSLAQLLWGLIVVGALALFVYVAVGRR